MTLWFAVHTHARSEAKASYNLRRQGFRTFAPEYRKRRSHARRVDHVPAPLFPRYIFVALEPLVTPWRAIQSTIGVCYLVCNGEKPVPVPDGIIDEIQARQDEAGFISTHAVTSFKKGQHVRIVDGALTDQTGLFDGADDAERVNILLDMLGRQVKVRMPIDSVAAAN
jgi:transcriptional antiterminator RfaH